mmetsp:Transcript_9444/g.35364  ORF Transcript_9444/g.35364 Transcript_9444/m.35364 type:complete len:258 (-) Transcript_9444:150-923(-)
MLPRRGRVRLRQLLPDPHGHLKTLPLRAGDDRLVNKRPVRMHVDPVQASSRSRVDLLSQQGTRAIHVVFPVARCRDEKRPEGRQRLLAKLHHVDVEANKDHLLRRCVTGRHFLSDSGDARGVTALDFCKEALVGEFVAQDLQRPAKRKDSLCPEVFMVPRSDVHLPRLLQRHLSNVRLPQSVVLRRRDTRRLRGRGAAEKCVVVQKDKLTIFGELQVEFSAIGSHSTQCQSQGRFSVLRCLCRSAAVAKDAHPAGNA